jgi:predicted RNase H-like HicB family nuclease
MILGDIVWKGYTVKSPIGKGKKMKIEIEQEQDGRWIAEVPDLPGVMVYGVTRDDAISKAETLALRVIADRLEHGEQIPELSELFEIAA